MKKMVNIGVLFLVIAMIYGFIACMASGSLIMGFFSYFGAMVIITSANSDGVSIRRFTPLNVVASFLVGFYIFNQIGQIGLSSLSMVLWVTILSGIVYSFIVSLALVITHFPLKEFWREMKALITKGRQRRRKNAD